MRRYFINRAGRVVFFSKDKTRPRVYRKRWTRVFTFSYWKTGVGFKVHSVSDPKMHCYGGVLEHKSAYRTGKLRIDRGINLNNYWRASNAKV